MMLTEDIKDEVMEMVKMTKANGDQALKFI